MTKLKVESLFFRVWAGNRDGADFAGLKSWQKTNNQRGNFARTFQYLHILHWARTRCKASHLRVSNLMEYIKPILIKNAMIVGKHDFFFSLSVKNCLLELTLSKKAKLLFWRLSDSDSPTILFPKCYLLASYGLWLSKNKANPKKADEFSWGGGR